MDELLKFDRGRHDDFVDTLSHIGRELGRMQKAPMAANSNVIEPKAGTMAWIKWAAKAEKEDRKRRSAHGGM